MSTYDKILTLAETYIQENGFQGFSYADLAQQLGIRKASIHHYFPSKNDLGIAFCQQKIKTFQALNQNLQTYPVGKKRLKNYLLAFKQCAEKKQMCGVHAMQSDSYHFIPALQEAVSELVTTELNLLQDILATGQQAQQFHFSIPVQDMTIIVCSSIKGALMLNRLAPHTSYQCSVESLIKILTTAPLPTKKHKKGSLLLES